ncbi:MAG: choloylglycine hydrolase [Lachnospiraceae bacterium]|nr:choloylglycine hydrolase [Lachnospiraceae bacterium]
MCTAATYKTKDHYFGRNLDLEYSYKETVTITPRNYHFSFRGLKPLECHYAIIGMAYVVDNYPLYYDGTNEEGLSMAGLNFPDNAYYPHFQDGKDNVAPFEFIPWILGQCKNVDEARVKLENINLYNEPFSEELPLSPLHWIIADREEAIVVEPTKDGLKIYDNPVGILTNNPPFPYHMINISNYMRLSKEEPTNTFADSLPIKPYSRGMGTMFLPGDLSSASRFVKATFTKMNSVSGDSERESVSQFFHILKSVEQQRGLVHMGHGKYELTIYTSCCNTDKGIYYYTTYDNSEVVGIDMSKEELNSDKLILYPLFVEKDIKIIN